LNNVDIDCLAYFQFGAVKKQAGGASQAVEYLSCKCENLQDKKSFLFKHTYIYLLMTTTGFPWKNKKRIPTMFYVQLFEILSVF
jgi:hypothetical protein